MLYLRLIVVVDGGRGIVKGSQQIGADVADFGRVLPQTVKNLFQVRIVQFIKAFLHLGGGKFLAADAEGGAGAA